MRASPTRTVPNELLKPFLSVALMKRQGKGSDRNALLKSVAEAEAFIAKRPGRTPVETFRPSAIKGTWLQAHVYRHRRLAAWAEQEFYDETHELLVLAVKDDNLAICCTEAGIREALVGAISAIERHHRKLLERAFVGQQAKAMWLKGVHAPTASKANAKSLIGPALELSLDPLGDQSFFYSAVKSHVPVAGATTLVGAAPGASRIWTARKPWAAFGEALDDIFDTVAAAASSQPAGQSWLKVLARDAGSIAAATDPYAMAIVPPELLTDAEVDPAQREIAIDWAYRASFEIVSADGPRPTAAVRIDGRFIGNIALDFETKGGRIVAAATWSDEVPGLDAERAACSELVGKPEYLRIYFDGATLADGRLFDPAYRDQRFDWRFEDFTNYAVTDEKPKTWGGRSLAEVIGEKKENGDPDDSLFAYVVEKLYPKGWLASDDGAMEFADFVHIDPATHCVTLIHAKGSNKDDADRGVSVASYEVVVGQAVKNIRHLDRTTLEQVLRDGVNKKIAGAVWLDGKRQSNRSGIIAAAGALPANHPRAVVVLQPQLTRQENSACVGETPTADKRRIARMRQLDTLMLSARLSCGAVGAEFVGIGSA